MDRGINVRYISDAITTPSICKSRTSVFLNKYYATMIYYFFSVFSNYIALQTHRHFCGAEDHCCSSDMQVTWFLNLILYLLYLFSLHLFTFTLCGRVNLSASLKHFHDIYFLELNSNWICASEQADGNLSNHDSSSVVVLSDPAGMISVESGLKPIRKSVWFKIHNSI